MSKGYTTKKTLEYLSDAIEYILEDLAYNDREPNISIEEGDSRSGFMSLTDGAVTGSLRVHSSSGLSHHSRELDAFLEEQEEGIRKDLFGDRDWDDLSEDERDEIDEWMWDIEIYQTVQVLFKADYSEQSYGEGFIGEGRPISGVASLDCWYADLYNNDYKFQKGLEKDIEMKDINSPRELKKLVATLSKMVDRYFQ